MTQAQFKKAAKQLKKEVSKMIDNRIDKVLKSGCLPLDSYGDTYELPKAFITAMASEIEFQFKPMTKELIKEANNIKHFL